MTRTGRCAISKESKSRDRFRQSIEAVRDRPETWCPGCGTCSDEHRPDCTITPAALHCADCDATRPAGALTPLWGYDTGRHVYLCPDHKRKHAA